MKNHNFRYLWQIWEDGKIQRFVEDLDYHKKDLTLSKKELNSETEKKMTTIIKIWVDAKGSHNAWACTILLNNFPFWALFLKSIFLREILCL